MTHSVQHILDKIYLIGDAGSEATRIAIGDPTGSRVKIVGTSYTPGSMLADGGPIHGVITGIFQYFSIAHDEVSGFDLSIAGSSASTAIGGDGASNIIVRDVIFELTAVAGAPLGTAKVSLGITPGGTEIFAATELTGLVDTSTMFIIHPTGLISKITDDSTFYITVTNKDPTAGAGTLCKSIIHYYSE